MIRSPWKRPFSMKIDPVFRPAPTAPAVIMGPTGPSPYDVVRGWHTPFAAPGFAFGGNSGVFAESPDRIIVAQRGEFRLPSPVTSAPGQFNGVHAVAVGPGGRIFALDRTGGRVNVYRTTPDPTRVEVEASWPGFSLPLDLIVNDDAIWMTDLRPLRFIKLDFTGQRLYTWLVPADLPDGYLESTRSRSTPPATSTAATTSTAARRSSCEGRCGSGAAHQGAVGGPPVRETGGHARPRDGTGTDWLAAVSSTEP